MSDSTGLTFAERLAQTPPGPALAVLLGTVDPTRLHGFELVDKHSARSTFFQGDVAEKFAASMRNAIAEDSTPEHIDEFLENFDVLLNLPVVYH